MNTEAYLGLAEEYLSGRMPLALFVEESGKLPVGTAANVRYYVQMATLEKLMNKSSTH